MAAMARYHQVRRRLKRYAVGMVAAAAFAMLAYTPAAFESGPERGLLQLRVDATSYACRICTGSDGKTRMRRGMIAVSDDLRWLWGRKVRIGGREFLVRDRMADNWRGRVDIYTPIEAEAWQWGLHTVTLDVERCSCHP
jgi:3D (Asp-Asp-Asp) domain-containing protein